MRWLKKFNSFALIPLPIPNLELVALSRKKRNIQIVRLVVHSANKKRGQTRKLGWLRRGQNRLSVFSRKDAALWDGGC